jgi:hypothetical protein
MKLDHLRRSAAAGSSSGDLLRRPVRRRLRAVGFQAEQSGLDRVALDQGRQIKIQESGSEDTGLPSV